MLAEHAVITLTDETVSKPLRDDLRDSACPLYDNAGDVA